MQNGWIAELGTSLTSNKETTVLHMLTYIILYKKFVISYSLHMYEKFVITYLPVQMYYAKLVFTCIVHVHVCMKSLLLIIKKCLI